MDFCSTTIFKLLVVCLCILNITCWAVDNEGCSTPGKEVGRCVPAKECQSLTNFLNSVSKPLPFYIKRRLRRYACGYEGEKVKVCCPESPIKVRIPQWKSSRKHRNFKLLPRECGYTGISNKISDGENAELNEYPWMALLSYKTPHGPKFKCGGTVINKKYILTAAHCITGLRDPLLGVRVGEYDISKTVDCEIKDDGNKKCASPVQDLAIEEVIPHLNFITDYDNRNGFNDIGLLRVSTMNLSTDNVEPICLPTSRARKLKSHYLIVAGWGYTEKMAQNNNVLQKVTLPVISHQKCQEHYKSINISRKQICTYGKTKETCIGDSGGPLQTQTHFHGDIRNIQYGIISFGGKFCGAGRYPDVYTKVRSYIYWILENMRP